MAVDLNAMMNNMMDSAKSVSTKVTEAPKDLLDIITQAFDRMVIGITRSAGISFVSKLGQVSVFQQAEAQGVGQKMMNESAGNFGARGGAVYNALSSLLTFDFKGLVASAVEPMQHLQSDFQGVSMSYGELGTLTPNVTFAGSVVSQGLSIG